MINAKDLQVHGPPSEQEASSAAGGIQLLETMTTEEDTLALPMRVNSRL